MPGASALKLLSYGSGYARIPAFQHAVLLRATAWGDVSKMYGPSRSPGESVQHSDNGSMGLGRVQSACILKWLPIRSWCWWIPGHTLRNASVRKEAVGEITWENPLLIMLECRIVIMTWGWVWNMLIWISAWCALGKKKLHRNIHRDYHQVAGL